MIKKIEFCSIILFAIFLLVAENKAYAAPFSPVPQDFKQPDGSIITVTAYGDEFFSWREDADGNIIAYDEATDSYKYAEIKDGKLVPTFDMVGKSSRTRRGAKKLQREDILPLWENAERADYTLSDNNNGVALLSMTEEQESEKPLTHQKLLVLLVEFSDVPIKFDCNFWNRQMFSTNPSDISVANYWKENANGLDIFEPADTSNVQIGREGLTSTKTDNFTVDYDNIRYVIDDCSAGVVKITLDMPHPTKIWNDETSDNADKAAVLAIHAVESDLDFSNGVPHIVTILAGYDVQYIYSEGKGEIHAHVPEYGIDTSDGKALGRFTVQAERYNENEAIGIGSICHELGHSVFNLPDLYFNNAIGATPNCGVCSYSLMSSGSSGHRCNSSMADGSVLKLGELPSHLDAWCKIQCGFVTPILKNEWDGNLNSISENGVDSKYNVLEVRSKTDPNQYFLIENRQLIGYDRGLEETNNYYAGDTEIEGGVIIWHIDEDVQNINNGSSLYHPFMWAEHSTNEWSPAKWAYTGEKGRNTFHGETTPNSHFHQLKVGTNRNCSDYLDCHPQTLKSGISIEVLSENCSSMRVKANVDNEYHVSMKEGATFTELFPDANFRRAVLDIMKKRDGLVRNPENVLSLRDWTVLTSTDHLNIINYGIQDLTGIEYFPVLHRLACSDNEITEIPSAQIPELDLLVCDNNGLTKLDLSRWVNLSLLYCNNNLLTELDTSNNVHLLNVDCSDNCLTSLDFSNNPELTSLYCHNNKLTSLIISNSEPLYDLVCSDNSLTSLDTSHNPKLMFLECANNNLIALDFTENPMLEYLWCYGNYMDPETPDDSIVGLEPLREALGPPHSKDDQEENWFAYFPQNTAEIEHQWSAEWQKDNTHHWHDCTDENCPIVDNTKKDGYAAHTKTQRRSSTQHWEVCPVCGWESEKTNHVYDNNQDTTCNICGYVRTVTPPVPISPPGPSEPVEPDLPDTPENCSRDENCALGKFTDTDLNAWYHDGVHYCLEHGLMSGYGGGRFGPNDSLTRGMLAQILYSEAGQPTVPGNSPFDDVASGAWYAKAVAWGTETGILSGYGNGNFGPDDPITREQLAVMLWRYAGSPAASGTLNSFSDQGKVSRYATEAMRWAVEKGILFGKGNGILDPLGKATRAETASILMNYCSLTF